MPATTVPLVESSTLPGVVLVERIRRLVLLSVILAVGYGMFVRGQKQWRLGAAGDWQLEMRPSPLIFAAAIVIVLVALRRVVRIAETDDDARRILGRAAYGIVALFVIGAVVSFTWFALVQAPDGSNPYTTFFPFPFATGALTTTP